MCMLTERLIKISYVVQLWVLENGERFYEKGKDRVATKGLSCGGTTG